MTYHDQFSARELVESPLGVVAADLRGAFDMAGGRGVMINSWAGLGAYSLHFGLGLGLPEAVRRPRFDAFQRLVYLLPKRPDGEFGVAVCLYENYLQRLKDDGELTKLATIVG
ncbi:uncharacterized protein PG998_014643 [Apiospora kogelbergensis]|uniref:uncharacterized protein n=1 Tax=Apiospora kogelbergensis TaxID=1337665 RepID=UPI00312FA116